MNLSQFSKLLISKDVLKDFPEIVTNLQNKINKNLITEFSINKSDKNAYPCSHFFDIYESRLKYMKLKNSKIPLGFVKSVENLKKNKEMLSFVGDINTKDIFFIVFLSKDFSEIIGLILREK